MRIEDLLSIIDLAAEDSWRLQSYANPVDADGSCGTATDIFHDLVEELFPDAFLSEVHFNGVDEPLYQDIPVVPYKAAPHPWYLGGCRWPGHCVAQVDEWLVDWTARQFNPRAPFPLVFRRDAVKGLGARLTGG